MNMNPVLRLVLLQISLENSNKALLELQENYRVAMSTLREKELIISSLLSSGEETQISLNKINSLVSLSLS